MLFDEIHELSKRLPLFLANRIFEKYRSITCYIEVKNFVHSAPTACRASYAVCSDYYYVWRKEGRMNTAVFPGNRLKHLSQLSHLAFENITNSVLGVLLFVKHASQLGALYNSKYVPAGHLTQSDLSRKYMPGGQNQQKLPSPRP